MNTIDSSSGPILFVIAVIVIVGLVAYYAWYFPRSQSVLKHWAARNEFEIVHEELKWFYKGPFTWLNNRGHTVYRIKVRDKNGQERTGWVRCGGIWLGLFSDEATVKWDEDK